MPPIDPPYRLDPFRNIVNVGWGGVSICALEFSFTWNGTRPAFPLDTMNFTSATYDVFTADVRERATGVLEAAPAIVNPVSREMSERLIIWNKGPVTAGPTADNVATGRALWFFNISKLANQVLTLQKPIAKFRLGIPASNGTHAIGGGVQYYVFPTFIEWVSPDGGPSAVFIDSVWSTLAEAQARVDVLNEHSSYRVITETGTPTTVPDTLSWTFRATTYRGRKDFPVNAATNEPTWSFAPGPPIVDGATRNNGGLFSQPARSINVTINTQNLHITADVI